LNGSHRLSALAPKALVPGEFTDFVIPLRFTTWTFPPGHKIRLAISNAAFPMLWPTPFSMESSVLLHDTRSALTLPVISPAQRLVATPRKVEARREATGTSSAGSGWPTFPEIKESDSKVHAVGKGEEVYSFGAWKVRKQTSTDYWVDEKEPSRAGFEGTMWHEFRTKGRSFKLSSKMEITSDTADFLITFKRAIFRDEALLRERTWVKKIPRSFQ
jgi:uncharacterized protein